MHVHKFFKNLTADESSATSSLRNYIIKYFIPDLYFWVDIERRRVICS